MQAVSDLFSLVVECLRTIVIVTCFAVGILSCIGSVATPFAMLVVAWFS